MRVETVTVWVIVFVMFGVLVITYLYPVSPLTDSQKQSYESGMIGVTNWLGLIGLAVSAIGIVLFVSFFYPEPKKEEVVVK